MTADLSDFIDRLGRDLVACHRACEGVVCDQTKGYIPRCLFLEAEQRSGARGAAIIGLNPGRSSHREQQYYLDRQCTYDSVVAWFRERGIRHPYYKHLRKLVDALGLTGPILWSELAKCENAPAIKELPLQTFRTCTATFLQRELEKLPEDWPLFGVGREAYKGLAYRFPNRTVLGVPHPTGSRGHFHNALFENGHLSQSAAEQAKAALAGEGRTLWLS